MSDCSITIVPKLSTYPNCESKASEILVWLIKRDIVKFTNHGSRYTIADQAYLVTEFPQFLPFDRTPNELEIITERQVFDSGGNGIMSLICPNCQEDIASDDWDLGPWYRAESDDLLCPSCSQASEIHTYSFEPDWGFSNLGFRFWNWPSLTEQFITEFEERLGCEVSVVYQRI